MADNWIAGTIGWHDLTVEDAAKMADFYHRVVGWEVEEVDVDGYQDFVMKDADGQAVAGICHARGENVNVPAQWLFYLRVADLDAAIAHCEALGGRVVVPRRDLGGYGLMCVIEDPAGAVAALIQPPAG